MAEITVRTNTTFILIMLPKNSVMLPMYTNQKSKWKNTRYFLFTRAPSVSIWNNLSFIYRQK